MLTAARFRRISEIACKDQTVYEQTLWSINKDRASAEQLKALNKIRDDFLDHKVIPPAVPYPMDMEVAHTKKLAPKKGKPMCYDCDCDSPRSDEKIKRDALSERIYEIYRKHDTDLLKTFGLDSGVRVRTPALLIKMIQEGKFIIDEGKSEYDTYSPMDFITFRDPSIKKDQAGYDTAEAKLQTSKQKYIDRAMFGDLADAVKILEDFESDTFH